MSDAPPQGMWALAVVMDVLFFNVPSLRWMAWSNFLFIWLSVHQLGYAWQDGLKSGSRARRTGGSRGASPGPRPCSPTA